MTVHSHASSDILHFINSLNESAGKPDEIDGRPTKSNKIDLFLCFLGENAKDNIILRSLGKFNYELLIGFNSISKSKI